MQKKYTIEVRKAIMMLCCIILAAFLASYSNLNFPKLIVIAMIVYFVFSWKCKKISALVAAITGLILCVYTGRYFVETMYPVVRKNSSTAYLQLTQVSIPGKWENHDMWISPIVDGKTVDLTYADEWCHAYFEEFSKDVRNNESETRLKVPKEYFTQLDEHYFRGTRDFFDEDILSMMYDGETRGYLFVATEELAKSDTVYVITDEGYNVYLMSYKILEKVLSVNEN